MSDNTLSGTFTTLSASASSANQSLFASLISTIAGITAANDNELATSDDGAADATLESLQSANQTSVSSDLTDQLSSTSSSNTQQQETLQSEISICSTSYSNVINSSSSLLSSSQSALTNDASTIYNLDTDAGIFATINTTLASSA